MTPSESPAELSDQELGTTRSRRRQSPFLSDHPRIFPSLTTPPKIDAKPAKSSSRCDPPRIARRRQWGPPPATPPSRSSLASWTKEPLKQTFQNVHQGYPTDTLVRFLKAREWHVSKARDMLVDSLNWRIQNEIDSILEGIPVFAIGVGQSTYDKASVHYYVQSHIQINEYRDRIVLPMASKKFGRPISTCIKVLDMTGLKLSALNQMKVVKPLLQERTRKKVHVLHGCGRDELLKIMDHSSLPHFCQREGSGSSKNSSNNVNNCFFLDHPFHQDLYHYIEEQALNQELIKQGSLHVNIPDQDPEDAKIVEVIEAEFHKLGEQNGSVNGDHKE
uniref:CRAL/TRIO N-terminal domain-containing protein n=1 Tax=Oryza meridionalis TaxID=40149 RepID=A0A0E0E3R0_9ORYZ